MPLSQSEKDDLQTKAQATLDAAQALVVDPVPNPLQVKIDAANAILLDAKNAAQTTLDKINAAMAALA